MIHGVLLLDKPRNISSNKALYLIKKKLSPKKAGIVGILDPLASGMLPIVLNEASGFLRSELATVLVTRTTPKLRFHYDCTIERGARMNKAIDKALLMDERQRNMNQVDE